MYSAAFVESFLSCLRRSASGCMEWTKGKNSRGYGYARDDRLRRWDLAHRVAWRIANEKEIQTGMCICHRCDNKLCCNPDHLFIGTYADNTHDMISKGRDRHPVGSENGKSKLTQAEVDEIRRRYALCSEPMLNLATVFGVGKTTIRMIVSGRTWRSSYSSYKP